MNALNTNLIEKFINAHRLNISVGGYTKYKILKITYIYATLPLIGALRHQ